MCYVRYVRYVRWTFHPSTRSGEFPQARLFLAEAALTGAPAAARSGVPWTPPRVGSRPVFDAGSESGLRLNGFRQKKM